MVWRLELTFLYGERTYRHIMTYHCVVWRLELTFLYGERTIRHIMTYHCVVWTLNAWTYTFRFGGGRVLIWNLPSSSTEEDVGRVGAALWSKGTDLANSASALGICISSDEFSVQREIKWEFYCDHWVGRSWEPSAISTSIMRTIARKAGIMGAKSKGPLKQPVHHCNMI